MKPHYGCPVQATVNVMSGKWKVQILWHLSFGALRFAELRGKLKGVSEKVMAAQLRQMEANGMVAREVIPGNPPGTSYSLTPAGMELIPAMESLCAWGTTHLGVPSNLPRHPSPAA